MEQKGGITSFRVSSDVLIAFLEKCSAENIALAKRGDFLRASIHAFNNDEEIARTIGVDGLIYQDLSDLQQTIRDLNPALQRVEASCFDGQYITGDITPEYLARLSQSRGSNAGDDEAAGGLQFNMGHVTSDT